MSDMILEHLRAIRADTGRINERLNELNTRAIGIERGVAALRRDKANQAALVAQARGNHLAARSGRAQAQ